MVEVVDIIGVFLDVHVWTRYGFDSIILPLFPLVLSS